MSIEAVILVVGGAMFLITAVSGRLDRLWLTEPLLASVLGVIVGLSFLQVNLESALVLTVLELTLALVLFTDASRIDLAHLRDGYSWSLKMLVIGLPVVVALGTLVAMGYLGLPLGLALLLGVVLAPTDAALAEPVLEAETVPDRVRQTLNVESGLNDGLAVPLLLIAIAIIDSEEGASLGSSVSLFVSQLGLGIVGGLVMGWLGATVIGRGARTGWMNPLHQKIAAVALALAGFAAVQLVGGSGFVATFIAGGLMGHLIKPHREYLYNFAEAEGHSLVLLAFFLIGAGPAVSVIQDGVSVEAAVMAAISLFVLRPVAIWISLLGENLKGRTVLFLGWFGPRGLATVVFVLVVVEELGAIDPLVLETLTLAVLASIVLHGLSAVPMSRWLGSMEMEEDMPEMGEAYPHAMRRT
ncbi:MAG TPA: cation:proton antiporter [Acidimicrobiia bacterium]|nr:cation:proton antiporter [Acidimicrobiia bacterium]